jgi:uncharacterized delta-60 repeat protein
MKKHLSALLGILAILTVVSACGARGGVTTAPAFTVGGVVSGSTGTAVLQNNGSNDLSLTTNGPYSFPASAGSSYHITVLTNPAGQTCIVTNSTGTVILADVTNVDVECFTRGGLDTSNFPKGFVVQSNTAGGNGDDTGNAVLPDAKDRILIAGSSTNSAGNTDMTVWRFNTDGSLDTTFNGTGFVVHNSAAGGNADDAASALALDLHGRILVTGSSRNLAGNADMVIWRFNPDGSFDATFNGGGIVVNNSAAGGNADDAGNAITIDSQGRIVVAGTSRNIAGNIDMAIWRFNANGTIDTALNGSGIVVHNAAAGGNADDAGNAVTTDAQGRIIVTGTSINNAGNIDMAIWRFNANGSLDSALNGSGIVVHNSAAGGNGDDAGKSVVLDPQGRIVVAGTSRNNAGNADMVIWRFNADGALDANFNGDGIVVNNGAAGSNGDDSGNAITIDADGRLLVTGISRNIAGNADLVIWRYNSDGRIDTTFGADGIVVHNGAAGGNGDDGGNAVITNAQQRILVTGRSRNSAGDSDMVLWGFFP